MGVHLSKPSTTVSVHVGVGPNGIKFGVGEMQGWRRNMEDSHIAVANINSLLTKGSSSESSSLSETLLSSATAAVASSSSSSASSSSTILVTDDVNHSLTDSESVTPASSIASESDMQSVTATNLFGSPITEPMAIFGVFDGHGGKEVAKFVQMKFVSELIQIPEFEEKKFEDALKKCFHRMDEMLEDAQYDTMLREFRSLPNPSDTVDRNKVGEVTTDPGDLAIAKAAAAAITQSPLSKVKSPSRRIELATNLFKHLTIDKQKMKFNHDNYVDSRFVDFHINGIHGYNYSVNDNNNSNNNINNTTSSSNNDSGSPLSFGEHGKGENTAATLSSTSSSSTKILTSDKSAYEDISLVEIVKSEEQTMELPTKKLFPEDNQDIENHDDILSTSNQNSNSQTVFRSIEENSTNSLDNHTNVTTDLVTNDTRDSKEEKQVEVLVGRIEPQESNTILDTDKIENNDTIIQESKHYPSTISNPVLNPNFNSMLRNIINNTKHSNIAKGNIDEITDRVVSDLISTSTQKRTSNTTSTVIGGWIIKSRTIDLDHVSTASTTFTTLANTAPSAATEISPNHLISAENDCYSDSEQYMSSEKVDIPKYPTHDSNGSAVGVRRGIPRSLQTLDTDIVTDRIGNNSSLIVSDSFIPSAPISSPVISQSPKSLTLLQPNNDAKMFSKTPPRITGRKPVPTNKPDDKDRSNCVLKAHRVPAGCTAIVALKYGMKLYVANAGDSRAVLCRGDGSALALSEDHKPLQEKELSRIMSAGGFVTKEGRINGNLNLSRSLGDLKYKQGTSLPREKQMITAEPDIRVIDLEQDDQFIILGCDGVWDCLTNQEACDFVSQRLRNGLSIKEIVTQACHRCLADETKKVFGVGTDNVTFVLVVLR